MKSLSGGMKFMSLLNHAEEMSLVNLIEQLEQQVTDGKTTISTEQVQELLCLAIKLYINKLDEESQLPPFPPSSSITATEALITVSRILKQINVEVFELAMWQNMGTN